jgi:hypothetical protein
VTSNFPALGPLAAGDTSTCFEENLTPLLLSDGKMYKPVVNVLDPNTVVVKNEVDVFPRGAADMGSSFEGSTFPSGVYPKGSKPAPFPGFLGTGVPFVSSILPLARDLGENDAAPCETIDGDTTTLEPVGVAVDGTACRDADRRWSTFFGTMWGIESHPLLHRNSHRAIFTLELEDGCVTEGFVSVHMLFEGAWGPATEGFSHGVPAEDGVHDACVLADQLVPHGKGVLSIRNAEERYQVVLDGSWHLGYFNEEWCAVGMSDCRYMSFVDAGNRWLTDRRHTHGEVRKGVLLRDDKYQSN